MESIKKYRHLVWAIAGTDFRLRYHGSALGYAWSLLQPLLLFTVMYFVFSSVFSHGAGKEYYALELLTGLMLFTFFSEGTSSVLTSLFAKKSVIKKIYVPLWTIIMASSLNAAFVFFMNIVVIIAFFAWQQFLPSISSVFYFLLSCIQILLLILSFGFATAPLYPRFRDLKMIWQVVTRVLMYASPIIYPLSMMPEKVQKILLLNPIAFIIHFMKQALLYDHYPTLGQALIFNGILVCVCIISIIMYKRFTRSVAQDL